MRSSIVTSRKSMASLLLCIALSSAARPTLIRVDSRAALRSKWKAAESFAVQEQFEEKADSGNLAREDAFAAFRLLFARSDDIPSSMSGWSMSGCSMPAHIPCPYGDDDDSYDDGDDDDDSTTPPDTITPKPTSNSTTPPQVEGTNTTNTTGNSPGATEPPTSNTTEGNATSYSSITPSNGSSETAAEDKLQESSGTGRHTWSIVVGIVLAAATVAV